MTSAGARFGIVFLPESLGGFGSLCREAEEGRLGERPPDQLDSDG